MQFQDLAKSEYQIHHGYDRHDVRARHVHHRVRHVRHHALRVRHVRHHALRVRHVHHHDHHGHQIHFFP